MVVFHTRIEVIWVTDVSGRELIAQQAFNSQEQLSGALQTERCSSDVDNVPPLKPGTPLHPPVSALPHFKSQQPINIK